MIRIPDKIPDLLDWDEVNLDHAQRHGISRAEIEQAVRNPHRVVPAPPGDWSEPEGTIRLLMFGETDGGLRLLAVFAWPAYADYGNGVTQIFTDRARPITAFKR
ncbi:hypothetical protein ABGB12_23200 [Actinocorallia sp. B10E7]|uniref:hypothetical protein n=1 Tax=Actinocorallia sp. B10E7 TaxID=3153558 RepID=UPI00325E0636